MAEKGGVLLNAPIFHRMYRNPTARLTVLYVIIGGIYIYLSDLLLPHFITDPEVLTRYQTYKGWAFILVTATLLFFLLRRYRRQLVDQEQTVWESKQQFQAITEQIPDIIYHFHLRPERQITYISPAVEALTGFPRKRFYADPVFLFNQVHPDDHSILEENLADPELVQERQELRWYTHDGNILWLEHSSVPIYNPEGQFIAVQGVARDITERKREEETLRLQSAALDAAANGIFITDRKGLIQWANPALAELTGYSQEELIGANPRLLKSGQQDDAFYRKLWDTILAGNTWQGEVVNRRKDGTPYTERQTITPVTEERGEITHFIAIQEDITEEKKLEEQLIQSQKVELMGEVAGGIAHDFNNVLATISGGVQMIQLHSESEQSGQYFEMVAAGITRAETITDRLLTFIRSGAPDVEPISLQSFLYDIQQIADHTLPAAISVEVTEYQGRDLVPADKAQLQQVLLNMCINASHAMDGVGTITVGLRMPTAEEQKTHGVDSDTAYLCLDVSDSGTGMDTATQQRVFEPFFTTKAQGKGTGLGLAVAYKIIQNHDGWIDVESKAGEGTTFTIGLPLAEDIVIKESTETTQMGYAGNGEHIYLVEDEPAIRQLLQDHLESAGYQVSTAKNGEEAIERLESLSRPVDMLLTDLGLPDMSGEEVAHQILQSYPELPIIAMTGYVDAEKHQALKEQGFQTVLKKPFDLQVIDKTIAGILQGGN